LISRSRSTGKKFIDDLEVTDQHRSSTKEPQFDLGSLDLSTEV
jgi:hypothetical protein